VNLRLLLAFFVTAALLLSVSFGGQRHAAHAATLRACGPDTIPLPPTDARRVGGDVVGVTALGTWGTSACLLRDRLTFAVKRSTDRFSRGGVIRPVRGNPATKIVNVVLKPGSVLVYSWRWRNWCGSGGHFTLQARWSGLAYVASSQAVKPPICTSGRSRSTLSKKRPSISSCPTAAYQVTTGLGQPFRTRLIDFVQFTLRKRHLPCLLRHLRVNFAVQAQSNGNWLTLSQVQGNPGRRTVGTMLTQTYGAFDVFWAWFNWCGVGNRFRASAQVGTRTVAGPTSTQGATCQDPQAPSTLTPSYGHL
jgi:hypothetical protein